MGKKKDSKDAVVAEYLISILISN